MTTQIAHPSPDELPSRAARASPGQSLGPAPDHPHLHASTGAVEWVAARTFSAGLLAQPVFWCGQASFFLVLALYLQQGRGLSALNDGLVFTILAASYLAASVGAPALTERHGRRVLAAGALVLAAGHGLLLLTVADVGTGGSIAVLIPGLLLAALAAIVLAVAALTRLLPASGRAR